MYTELCVSGDNGVSDFSPEEINRQCYVCSGMYPDHECELYPEFLERGPGKMNCMKDYCTTHVRYRVKEALLSENDQGETISKLGLM